MAERDVTVKLGIKPVGDPSRSMRSISEEATKGSRAVGLLDRAFTSLEQKIKNAAKASMGMGGAGGGGGTFRLGGVQGFGATMGGLQQLNNSFKQLSDVTGFLSGRMEDASKKFGPMTDAVNSATMAMHDVASMFGSGRSKAILAEAKERAAIGRGLTEEERAGRGRQAMFAAAGGGRMMAAQALGGADQRDLIRGAIGESQERFRRGTAEGQAEMMRRRFAGGNLGNLPVLNRQAEELPRLLELQKQLIQIEQQRIDMIRQEATVRQQAAQETVSHLKREEDRLKEIVKLERDRVQGLKEQFGLATPAEQRAIRQLSERIAGGQGLSARDVPLAQRFNGLFGEQLGQFASQRGGAQGFDAIARNLGLNARGEQAAASAKRTEEFRLRVEQRLFIEAKIDAAELSQEINNKLQPEIRKFLALVAQQAAVDMERIQNQERLNKQAGVN